MSDLRKRYLANANGNKYLAIAYLAKDLMRGDKDTHKAGYSFENAIMAAAETILDDEMAKETIA